jgi:predicted alpha-1,2-mannosidase
MMPSVVETYLRIFREQGKLPVWHLMSQETDCMVGCPAVPILADALLKGYVKDSLAAWKAMASSLLMDERGLDDMKRLGYVANDHHGGSLSMTLEYMLADWSALQAGKAILNAQSSALGGSPAEMQQAIDNLDKRAHSYPNLYDSRVGFLRSKDSQGEFNPIDDFNPAYQTSDYTEGNPWQYLWLVPHDVHGLVSLFGSEERFIEKLDSLFIVEGDLGEDAPPDISGLIGQYAHGNEPSHHVLYLYNYVGQPWKGAQLIRRAMNELYHNAPDGLSGNEDVGQMSAWYILSALGLYQVEPAGGKYVIGSPIFSETDIVVGKGKTFCIRANNVNENNIYVQSAKLNGEPYTRSYIMYDDIMRGGILELQMGPQPSRFGTSPADRP